MKVDLNVELAGVGLRNPLILASGFIGNDPSLLRRAWDAGFGGLTTKSLTPSPREGYKPPIVVDLGYGYLNAVGLANPGLDALPTLVSMLPDNAVVILSVAGTTPKDFRVGVEKGLEVGVDMVELNLSCPHVKGMGIEIIQDYSYTLEIVREVVGLGIPILLKMGLVDDPISLASRALGIGVSGFTIMNTVRGLAIDVESGYPILSNVFGGLSGKAIHPIAVRMVYEIYSELQPDIIGTGGVSSWRDAIEFIYAGASAVGIGSYLFNRRVEEIDYILKGIVDFLYRKGFERVADAVGYSHRR